MGENLQSLTIDGLVDEVDGIEDALYEPYWEPVTGHPDGTTYIYVGDDADNLYISLDITMDNTNEFGEDWAAVKIGGKSFEINDFDETYGVCGFGTTSKVSYKHQTCEFKIPKSEIESGSVDFKLSYYGTGGGGGPTRAWWPADRVGR